jgi:hypothetical protein
MSFSTELAMTVKYLVWIDFDLVPNLSAEAASLNHDFPLIQIVNRYRGFRPQLYRLNLELIAIPPRPSWLCAPLY